LPEGFVGVHIGAGQHSEAGLENNLIDEIYRKVLKRWKKTCQKDLLGST